MSGIDETLVKLLAQLRTDDDIQLANAARGIQRYFTGKKIDPSELTILTEDFSTTWKQTLERTQRLDRENQFLRRHLPPVLLRKLAMAGEIDYFWPDLYALAQSRFIEATGGQLSKNWRKQLAELAQVSIQTVQLWEDGVARIPELVFEKLRALPDRGTGPRQRKPKTPRTEKHGFQWPDCLLQRLAELYLEGGSRTAMIAMAKDEFDVDITDGMITGKLEHSPPPDTLEVSVLAPGEPIDWPELWLIAATLFRGVAKGKRQRGWRTKALGALGLHTGHLPPYDLNRASSQERIDDLRRRYIEHNLSREKVKPLADSIAREPIVEMALAAGRTGITRTEVRNVRGSKYLRRVSELQKTLDLFDTGLKRKKNQVVYCHRQFATDHPIAWQKALLHFGNMRDTAGLLSG